MHKQTLKELSDGLASKAFSSEELTRHYLDRNHPCYLYDPLAVAVGIKAELVTRSEHLHVDIETAGEFTAGTTVVDWHGRSGNKKNVHICLEVDSEGFRQMFWDRVINENIKSERR